MKNRILTTILLFIVLLTFSTCKKSSNDRWSEIPRNYNMVNFGFEQLQDEEYLGLLDNNTDTSIKFISYHYPLFHQIEMGVKGFFSKKDLWPDLDINYISFNRELDEHTIAFSGRVFNPDSSFVLTYDQYNDITNFTQINTSEEIIEFTKLGSNYYLLIEDPQNVLSNSILKTDLNGNPVETFSIPVSFLMKHIYYLTDTSIYLMGMNHYPNQNHKSTLDHQIYLAEYSTSGNLVWKAIPHDLNTLPELVETDKNQLVNLKDYYSQEYLQFFDLKGNLIKSKELQLSPYTSLDNNIVKPNKLNGYTVCGMLYTTDGWSGQSCPKYIYLIEFDEDLNTVRKLAQKITDFNSPFSRVNGLHQINSNTYFISLIYTADWFSSPMTIFTYK